MHGIDEWGSFRNPISIIIAGTINIVFKMGYAIITANIAIPLVVSKTDKSLVKNIIKATNIIPKHTLDKTTFLF